MTELKMNDSELPSPKLYQGNCHCGQIRFELDLHQPLRHVFTCGCSMCSKKGYLWIFPAESQFRIIKGQQVMASFAENGRSGEHFVSYYLSFFDHLSLILFLLVLPFVWYRNNGEESYDTGGRIKHCYKRGWCFSQPTKSTVFQSDPFTGKSIVWCEPLYS